MSRGSILKGLRDSHNYNFLRTKSHQPTGFFARNIDGPNLYLNCKINFFNSKHLFLGKARLVGLGSAVDFELVIHIDSVKF